jgi:hypothetical protein
VGAGDLKEQLMDASILKTLPSNLYVANEEYLDIAAKITRMYFNSSRYISVSSLKRRMPYMLFDICEMANAPIRVTVVTENQYAKFNVIDGNTGVVMLAFVYRLEENEAMQNNFWRIANNALFNLSHLNIDPRERSSEKLVFYTRGNKFMYLKLTEGIAVLKSHMSLVERFVNWYHGLLHSKYKGNQSIIGYKVAG